MGKWEVSFLDDLLLVLGKACLLDFGIAFCGGCLDFLLNTNCLFDRKTMTLTGFFSLVYVYSERKLCFVVSIILDCMFVWVGGVIEGKGSRDKVFHKSSGNIEIGSITTYERCYLINDQ